MVDGPPRLARMSPVRSHADLKQLYGHNHISINQVIDVEHVIRGLLEFIDYDFQKFQMFRI